MTSVDIINTSIVRFPALAFVDVLTNNRIEIVVLPRLHVQVEIVRSSCDVRTEPL